MLGSKGQNLIEYILLVTAVAIVCIYFFSQPNGPMGQSINASLNGVVEQINDLNKEIQFK